MRKLLLIFFIILMTPIAAMSDSFFGALPVANVTIANRNTVSSAATGTGNIDISGQTYTDMWYSNGSSTATYTPVITSAPPSGTVRYVTLTVGGGSGVVTMTWTNVDFMGTAGAATTTTNAYNHYSCIIPSSGHAKCAIIAEASTY